MHTAVGLAKRFRPQRGKQVGVTRADDRLPDLLMQPLEDGGTEGTVPDLDTLLSGAYAEYGWDAGTGEPTQETLDELGLGLVTSEPV